MERIESHQKKNPLRAAMLAANLFLLLLICSCATQGGIVPRMNTETMPHPDAATLTRADRAFLSGDYSGALDIYTSLSQLSEKPAIRRKALYGLACTKLVLAENEAELEKAIVLWDTWSQTYGKMSSDEDPRMLRPVLIQKQTNTVPRKQVTVETSPAEKQVDKNTIRSQTDEIEDLKKTVSRQRQEIRTLKHQISSLEAIDQDILQKKKEISTQ